MSDNDEPLGAPAVFYGDDPMFVAIMLIGTDRHQDSAS